MQVKSINFTDLIQKIETINIGHKKALAIGTLGGSTRILDSGTVNFTQRSVKINSGIVCALKGIYDSLFIATRQPSIEILKLDENNFKIVKSLSSKILFLLKFI